MNILLIAFYFAPAYSIASVRPSKLCKYWIRQGHQVTVLTSTYDRVAMAHDHSLLSEELDRCRIIRSGYFSLYRLIGKLAISGGSGKKSAAAGSARKIYESPHLGFIRWLRRSVNEDNITWYWHARRYMRKLAKTENYDFIFSTSGPISSHQIGRYAKKLMPEAVWIADFRDHYIQQSTMINPMKIKRIKKAVSDIAKIADAFSYVSSSLIEAFSNEAGDIKTFVVTNGFDREDYNDILPVIQKDTGRDYLSIVYTGHLYGLKSDFSALFKAIRELEKDHMIDVAKVHLIYAGTCGAIVRQMAAQYGLEAILTDRGLIQRKDSLALQKSADALLLTLWNYKNENGILTGKVYEYMMQGNPIVALVNGDLAGSQIADIIRGCNLGVVWEQANDASDFLILKKALLEIYHKAINGDETNFYPDKEKIDRFSYNRIAAQLLDVVNEIRSSRGTQS